MPAAAESMTETSSARSWENEAEEGPAASSLRRVAVRAVLAFTSWTFSNNRTKRKLVDDWPAQQRPCAIYDGLPLRAA